MIVMELLSFRFKNWTNLFFGVLVSLPLCAADGQASFTPTEVQFPIQTITLSSEISSLGKPAGESFTIYECIKDDCLVEFSDNPLLDYDLVRKEI